MAAAIAAEADWLDGIGPEPPWPVLPPQQPSIRRRWGLVDDADGEDEGTASVVAAPEEFRSEEAARGLPHLTRSPDAAGFAWVAGFVEAYSGWTAAASGASLDPATEVGRWPRGWSDAFLPIMTGAVARMEPGAAADHVGRIASVPDNLFLAMAARLVPALDAVYFNGRGLGLSTALRLRGLIAARDAGGRMAQGARQGQAVGGLRMGPAIAALFFNHHRAFEGTSCYLKPAGIDLVDPFLSAVATLMENGPVPFASLLVMNLLEVSPRRPICRSCSLAGRRGCGAGLATSPSELTRDWAAAWPFGFR